jgi:hypothetical protein
MVILLSSVKGAAGFGAAALRLDSFKGIGRE